MQAYLNRRLINRTPAVRDHILHQTPRSQVVPLGGLQPNRSFADCLKPKQLLTALKVPGQQPINLTDDLASISKALRELDIIPLLPVTNVTGRTERFKFIGTSSRKYCPRPHRNTSYIPHRNSWHQKPPPLPTPQDL